MRRTVGGTAAAVGVGLLAFLGLRGLVEDGGSTANETIDAVEGTSTNLVESTGNVGRTVFQEGGSLFHTGADELGGVAARSAGALGAGANAASSGGAAATDGATRTPTVGGGG